MVLRKPIFLTTNLLEDLTLILEYNQQCYRLGNISQVQLHTEAERTDF